MATSIALTRSRSGILGFLVATAVVTIVMARRASRWRTQVLAVALGIVLAGGAVVWAGTDATLSRFSLASVDAGTRLSAWRDTWAMIEDFPWFGVGLGNYGTAMLLYQTAHRDTLFAQAHNDYLQVLAEGGVLVAVPALVAIAAIGVRVVRRFADASESAPRRWLRVGAVAGLAGIATQSLFEFSLQMPAIAALFALTIAVAVHRAPSSAEGDLRHAHRL
jgi:O-antigen ligase